MRQTAGISRVTRLPVCLAFWLFALICGLGAAMESAEPEGGKAGEAGKPKGLTTGFFFWEGKYVPQPYVVVRKGLELFINGISVRKYPGPKPVLPAAEDPGPDPPPGTSPWDRPLDPYWPGKWRYLAANYPIAEARTRMMEVYRKSPGVTEVRMSTTIPDVVECLHASGKVQLMQLAEQGNAGIPLTLSQIAKMAENSRRHWEDMLATSEILILYPSFEAGLSDDPAKRMMEILLSDSTTDYKVRVLQQEHLVGLDEERFRHLVANFTATPELRRRFDQTDWSPPPPFHGNPTDESYVGELWRSPFTLYVVILLGLIIVLASVLLLRRFHKIWERP